MAETLIEYLDELENNFYRLRSGETETNNVAKLCKMLRHVVTAVALVGDHTALDQVALLEHLDRMAKEVGE